MLRASHASTKQSRRLVAKMPGDCTPHQSTILEKAAAAASVPLRPPATAACVYAPCAVPLRPTCLYRCPCACRCPALTNINACHHPQLFADARALDAVLVFDEAEGLFGTRPTDMGSSTDRCVLACVY